MIYLCSVNKVVVIAQLICTVGFAYVKSRFSHEATKNFDTNFTVNTLKLNLKGSTMVRYLQMMQKLNTEEEIRCVFDNT